MKIIKRYIKIPLHDSRMIVLLNSISGAVICLSPKETEKFLALELGGMTPEFEKTNLYAALRQFQFIVPDNYDEDKEFNEVVHSLRGKDSFFPLSTRQIYFILSYDCNFRCPYCFEAEQHSDSIQEYPIMTRECVDAAFNTCPNATEVILFGGEPLLESNRDIIEYIFNKFPTLSYYIITNGYLLYEYVSLLKCVNVRGVQVTIDGPEAYHNRTRILKSQSEQGTYSRIMEGVKACLKEQIPVKIRMTITSDQKHLESCLALRDTLQGQFSEYSDFLSFELSPIFQVGVHRQLEMLSDLYSKELHNYNSDYNRVLDTEIPIVKSFIFHEQVKPQIKHCIAHTSNRVFFDPFGDMYTCISGAGNADFSIGKYYPRFEIKEHSLVNRDISNIKECMACPYALFCGGGCPAKNITDGVGLLRPNCTRTYGIFNEVLPMLLEQQIPYTD